MAGERFKGLQFQALAPLTTAVPSWKSGNGSGFAREHGKREKARGCGAELAGHPSAWGRTRGGNTGKAVEHAAVREDGGKGWAWGAPH